MKVFNDTTCVKSPTKQNKSGVVAILLKPSLALSIISAITVSSMVACTSRQPTQPVKVVQDPTPTPIVKPVIYNKPVHQQPAVKVASPTQPLNNTPHYANLSEWKVDFINRARAKGYNTSPLQRLLNTAEYNSRVVSLDSNQAEFVKMPWEYVENAVSAGKITTGRQKFANNPNTFGNINRQYAISPYVVTAIWGIESSYGGFTGSSNLASSLSTLAYDGRRREFAENQLLALSTLLSRGDVSWYNLDGSWAGGMGHTQFIPSTWLVQGVDANGDGHKNPWNPDDALASTANYLTRSGWISGLDPYYEVMLPNGFDYSHNESTKTLSEWMSYGIQIVDSNSNLRLSSNTPVKLWLPAGKDGPVLFLTKNFDVIKVYNNSSNYALGVSLLAKRIAGRQGLQKAWPKYEKPLSKYQARQLQQRLTDLGYNTNGVDGIIGTQTRKAFQRWQRDTGRIADGFISQRTTNGLVN